MAFALVPIVGGIAARPCGYLRAEFCHSAYSIIALQASLSPVIDLAKGRKKPTPFGTQHVALLCAAWGPCILWSSFFSLNSQVSFLTVVVA
jgi:hypothetical protein